MKMNIGWIWFKNSEGKPDTMLSFSIMAFAVVVFKVLFGGISVVIGTQTFMIIPIDPAMVAALLVPTLGAYVSRRYTTAKFTDANNNGINDEDEK